MLTSHWKSLRKRLTDAPKTGFSKEKEREREAIHAIMRLLLSTLTEPGAFIQEGGVPWRKERCTLA